MRDSILVLLMMACCAVLPVFTLSFKSLVFKSATAKATEDRSISLVVSISAADSSELHPHRAHAEAEKATRLNLANYNFKEVVVILDSVTAEDNCSHFVSRMSNLADGTTSVVRRRPLLTCIDHSAGQPTYYEMIRYTLAPSIKGRVVVMSKADIVFDETISIAGSLNLNSILTLTTWGPHKSHSTISPNNSAARPLCLEQGGASGISLLPFETFIYDRGTIKQTIKKRHFNNHAANIQMDDYQAQYAALEALAYNVEGVVMWNACNFVRSWYLGPKEEVSKPIDSENPVMNHERAMAPLCLHHSKECSDSFIEIDWSGYSLNDRLIGYGKIDKEWGLYLNRYPGSIAVEFLAKQGEGKLDQNFLLLVEMVKKRILSTPDNDATRPPPDSCIFHLRIGDVMNEDTGKDAWESRGKKRNSPGDTYIFSKKYYENALNLIPKKVKAIMLVGSTAHHLSRVNRGYLESVEYIALVTEFFNSHGFEVYTRIDQFTPDEDFLFMVQSPLFGRGGGEYSNTIKLVVKQVGGSELTQNQSLRKWKQPQS